MATQPTAVSQTPSQGTPEPAGQDEKAAQRARLGATFVSAPDTLSAEDMSKLADAYRRSGQTETALRICEAGLARFPDDLALRTLQANMLAVLGRGPQALAAYEALFARHEDILTYQGINRYQHLLRALPPAERLASRRRATGPVSQQAERAFKRLEQGRTQEAARAFARALEMVLPDPGLRADWRAAFAALSEVLSRLSASETGAETGSEPGAAPGLTSGPEPSPPVLITSGTGWSGSSALFDYFAEFDDTLPRGGEFPVIEGRHGLADLARARGAAQIGPEVLGLFRHHFFGFSAVTDAVRGKCLLHAKHSFLREDPAGGAALARDVFTRLARELTPERVPTACLQDVLARYMFFKSGIAPDELGSRKLLFDNIVHADKLDTLAFTRNLMLIVCLRDPRSTYVSRLKESNKPDETPAWFIQRYRLMRERVTRLLDQAAPADATASSTRLVQFEPFVLSRAYRQDLARSVGLDPTRQREYSRFKPEVSRRNLVNFRTHPDQEAIRRIEAELGEYCLDLESLERRHPPDRA